MIKIERAYRIGDKHHASTVEIDDISRLTPEERAEVMSIIKQTLVPYEAEKE